MRISRQLIPVLLLALTACGPGTDRPPSEVVALQDSMRRLNDMEERVFTLVGSDDSTGRLVLQGSAQAIQALEQEAREAFLVGCAGQARDALTEALHAIISSSPEVWPKVNRYRNAAEACDGLLEAQGRRWPGKQT